MLHTQSVLHKRPEVHRYQWDRSLDLKIDWQHDHWEPCLCVFFWMLEWWRRSTRNASQTMWTLWLYAKQFPGLMSAQQIMALDTTAHREIHNEKKFECIWAVCGRRLLSSCASSSVSSSSASIDDDEILSRRDESTFSFKRPMSSICFSAGDECHREG